MLGSSPSTKNGLDKVAFLMRQSDHVACFRIFIGDCAARTRIIEVRFEEFKCYELRMSRLYSVAFRVSHVAAYE